MATSYCTSDVYRGEEKNQREGKKSNPSKILVVDLVFSFIIILF